MGSLGVAVPLEKLTSLPPAYKLPVIVKGVALSPVPIHDVMFITPSRADKQSLVHVAECSLHSLPRWQHLMVPLAIL